MIDSGADAVVGGHPHVTQNIEVYKGKPIFYSLGNFIFNGFTDKESNTGWVLSLNIVPPMRSIGKSTKWGSIDKASLPTKGYCRVD